MDGYIKLYRKIEEWEWYKDIPTKVLFFHLLVRVNFVEKKWQGIIIKKGEIVTSMHRLSEETGLSGMQIRTAIKKLKSTNEITSQSTNSFTHIQVINWEEYQGGITNQITIQEQTDNKPITTTKEREERKEYNTEIVASTKNENEIFFENIQTDTDTVLNNMNIPEEHRDQGRQELFKFWNYWTEKDLRGKERWRKEKTFEVKRRLTTWLMNTKQFTNKTYEKPKFTR